MDAAGWRAGGSSEYGGTWAVGMVCDGVMRPASAWSPPANNAHMATFLLKTEPGEYSFDDLVREKRSVWTGVSNPQALIHIRSMKKGDAAFIYHTGNEKAIVGLGKVVSDAYEDPKQPGKNDKGEPKQAVVDVSAVKGLKKAVTLAEMKADARFKDFVLLKNSRLSVMPVPENLAKVIAKVAGLE